MRSTIAMSIVIGIALTGWPSLIRAEAGPDRGAARAAREKVAAEREGREAKVKAEREAREAKAREEREARQKDREAARDKVKAEAEARKEKRDADKTPGRGKEIDNREARQERRINHGIRKGYLTDEEVQTLQSQQDRIAAMEEGIKADGKISREEFKSINQALNDASRCIWAEKHDTDGKQMPTYRLGKDVFAKEDFTAKLADENLSREQARALLKDFHRLTALKRTLATKDLEESERKELQEEYNTLLNKYFEVR